ncbi:hypothetical protein LTR20_001424 [Exophiala xenobiotica]|nr:hypothetical protein LTR41_005868 [Exophiala xenobiotica]KAK5251727.1 hypothetical protein LTS06_003670 [Exophiala xenobiotica]KAK5318947.1 hypothetical protein LTR93_007641 [Exophiala xenobiotica]KAK5373105.1 hypothetical protein LTR11_005844 [Exophiala xenobiotica]KAK5415102.1 hypothetical protein LTR90_006149 [Exophiala xenobiotica]
MRAATSYSQTDLDFSQPTTKSPEQVSHIVDREQFGVYTDRGSNVSQKPKNDHFGRQIGPSHLPERPLLRLPAKLVRRFRDVLRGRNKNDPHTSNQACADPAPLLAPSPLSRNANDRLGPELQEKPKIPPIREFIHSPLLTVKEVIANEGGEDFAQNVGKAEVSHGANVALVIENARVRQSNEEDGASCDEDVLDGLKQSRQDSFTRWTMDRHVRNVGRIQPHVIPLRARKEFLQRNAQGRERIDWIGYGQHLWQYTVENYLRATTEAGSEFPDPSQELLMATLERVILASRPAQSLFLYLRKISRWETPLESLLFMFAYFSLAILIIFKVIYRYLCPQTIEEMHLRLIQSEDKTRQAEDLSELITKYGTHGWIDRLIEMAGPMLLYHCESLADALEMIQNFYEWRNPRETCLCLFRLTSLLALLALLPTWVLVQSLFTISGILFFAMTPVSVLFPRYRTLTSPCSWLFGRIPTHADWAIARLQEEARQQLCAIHQAQALKQEHCTTEPDSLVNSARPKADQVSVADDITVTVGGYKCRDGNRGRLLVTTRSATFLPSKSGDQKWAVEYTALKRIYKTPTSYLPGQDGGLCFVDMDGIEHEVTNLRSRDQVFSQIIGYSDVHWKRTG